MRRSLLGAALAALLATPAAAVTIDWVPIGNPGNAADTASNCFPAAANCGSVAYSYAIDKYEVTNAQYAELLNAKAAADLLGLYNTWMGADASNGGITRSGVSGSYRYAVKSGFANKPVTWVSFYAALRFANWLNNGQGSGDTETGAYTLLGGTAIPSNGSTVTRNAGANIVLPSENEWYKAAYFNGTSYFAYPAGTSMPTVCALPGATPNTANCNFVVSPRGPGQVTDVGAYAGSASPYGTFDQGGNVDEWNERFMGSSRGIRGGSWAYAASSLAASSPDILLSAGSGSDYLGFRVARLVPEPGMGLLGMTGVLGLALCRKRPAKAR